MELSNRLKQRFLKDYSLPFQVVQEPIFSYQIAEIDSHYNTIQKLEMLKQSVIQLGNEEEIYQETARIKESLIEKIMSQPEYKELEQDRLENYSVKNNIPQQDIYSMNNDGKCFLSIDLKHANFNVFKMYSPSLVLNHLDYESLISSETDLDYFKQSKYLRQVIFGNLLPKKQQRLQKWIIDKIITVLVDELGIDTLNIQAASSDEIVIEIDYELAETMLEKVKTAIQTNPNTMDYKEWLSFQIFKLKSIDGRKFFVKESLNSSKVEFKAIQSYFFMQVYKKYIGKPITEQDKVFYFDGMLASFKKSLFDDDFVDDVE